MRKKPLVTASQLVLMIVGSALIYPYTYMQILVTPPSNQDIWIVLLLSAIYIIIINVPTLFIINKFRGLSASQKIQMILGKPIGKAAAVLYVLFFIFYSMNIMVINGIFIKIYLIPETPLWAITILMAIPAVYMSYKGAGTIGRTSSFFVILLLVSVIFFFVFGINKMNINEIKPILADSTFAQLNLGAFITAVRFSSILILFIFSFHINEKVHVIKVFG